MPYRWIFLSLALAVAAVNNLHLPVMQVFAWAGMLVSYSQEADIATAVEMTFDGENPCPLCTAIKAQQIKTNPDQLQAASTPSITWFFNRPPAWVPVTEPIANLHVSIANTPDHTFPPETPPPRPVA